MNARSGNNNRGYTVVLVALCVLVLLLVLLSLGLGRYPVPIGQLVRMFAGGLGFDVQHSWTDEMAIAVFYNRMPRILLALLVGACLSSAGSCYQGVFRNPMASPDVLGASSGAAFGAALAIYLGLSGRGITLLAFVSSLSCVLLVYLVSLRARTNTALGLVLAGIMISSFFSSGTSFIKLVADTENQLPAITYWLMGSLADAEYGELGFAALVCTVGLVPLFLLRWRMNLLTLGDDEARTLGVNANALRLVVIICSTLITAASVAVSGMIGWIGLVVPHLGRLLVGSDYKRLLPASMLIGAGLLLLVDDLARTVVSFEIPIGILTAFVGAPFFIVLILRSERRYES